jgi:GT2 family glycosyltransferase
VISKSELDDPPSISALVCTFNRGASIVDTVSSILAIDHPRFELVIIDQSTNDEAELATKCFRADRRFKFVRSKTVGKGEALDHGLKETTGELIAITDDDCTVPANWLEMFECIFAQHKKVAVCFCNVDAGQHDACAGFIPTYVRTSDKLLKNLRDMCGSRGIGAGIAVRRSMVEKLGGFDTMLGPGSRFPDGDDFDIKSRAILSGYEVYESAAFSVTHFGFRTWQQGRELTRRNYLGLGAAFAKPLKCGRWAFTIVLINELGRFIFWPLIWDLLRLRRTRGFTRFTAFVRGFIGGLSVPVDKATIRFIDQSVEASSCMPERRRGSSGKAASSQFEAMSGKAGRLS